MKYLTALAQLHETLTSASYVEIGCREGRSLTLARCPALAIDPDFEIRAEFALRDILNLEQHARHNSVIVIDDVLPEQMEWTTRKRLTHAWTGDVYKVIPFLFKHRPGLDIRVFDIEMKGMAIITGLNPGDRSVQNALPRHEAVLAGEDWACASIADLRAQLAPEPAAALPAFVDALAARRGAPAPARMQPDATIYLDLLKRSLLKEIYLDDELRLLYLRDCLSGAETFDYAVLHDIRTTRCRADRQPPHGTFPGPQDRQVWL